MKVDRILVGLWVMLLLCLALFLQEALARDPGQVRAFRKLNACPTTGKFVGACPGQVVDHKIPLCLQPLFRVSLDAPWNMQWQESKESFDKDAEERAACARLKKLLQK